MNFLTSAAPAEKKINYARFSPVNGETMSMHVNLRVPRLIKKLTLVDSVPDGLVPSLDM